MATAKKKVEDLVLVSQDLGSGFTKYSKKDSDGNVTFHSFPSLAPKHTGKDFSMGLLQKRDTVVVDLEGTEYEVGPDSSDLDTGGSTRNLNDNYIYTEQYKAVFLGGLYYSGEKEIDLLVLGLPISGMDKAADLVKLATGTHKINEDNTVIVKNVIVLPQPLGGLYHCLSLKDIEELKNIKNETNLIIDPGFLTFDFLLTNGLKIIDNKSDASDGGVSKILRSISNTISKKFDIKYDNLNAIDKGLINKEMKVKGKKEDLMEHIKATKSIIEGSVNYMRNMVGNGSDIDNIILLGGGSDVFKKTIENQYKDHNIISIENPQTANVRGFYEAGLTQLELLLK